MNNNNKRTVLEAFSIIFILYLMLFSNSCANTSTPPSGGPKDTIPPVLLLTTPPSGTVNFPVENRKNNSISLTFNEYVVLKDIQENLYLSPPQEKFPKTKIKGKSVIVTFEEPLDSNTTYSLDFGQGIVDNNEGNVFHNYVYSFSTGKVIDSLYASGNVVDAKTMLPQKGVTVLFYKSDADSAVFNSRPDASAKTDEWGYFTVRNLKPDKYHVYAISDINKNNKYDPSSESIAFLDSVFSPTAIMSPDSLALKNYDMKDTLACLARPSELHLSLFTENATKQFIRSSERTAERAMYIKFTAPDAEVKSLQIEGIDSSKIIKQFNILKDSLSLWINDDSKIADTLNLFIDYMATDDSLSILVPKIDTLEMIKPKEKKSLNKRGKAVVVKDTSVVYDITATPSTIEQEGIILDFNYPLSIAPFDSISISYLTPQQQEMDSKFTVTQDSTDIKKYIIKLKDALVTGYEYTLKIPKNTFYDINGLPADSLVKKFKLPSDDNLSTLTLDITNIEGYYVVELINEKRDKVIRKYSVNKECKLDFPYLKANKYSIRITEDKNDNGIIDTGDVLKKKQPEKVILVKIGKGSGDKSFLLDLPAKTELEQTINIGELFK